MIRLKDIAEAAKVSEGTASLAVNNRRGVNEDTRKKVLKLAKEMGYFASANAKGLAKKRSGLIGVLVPNITNIFYSRLVSNIERLLRDMGFKMILVTTENNIDYEIEMIQNFISFRVEGAIIYPMIEFNPDSSYMNMLDMNGIPYVFIGGYYPNNNAPHVMSTLYDAISEATEYLYDSGCREFCYIGGCKTIIANVLKLKAMQDTLKKRSILFTEDKYIQLEESNYENAYTVVKKYIRDNPKTDAFVTGNIYIALAVYNVAIEYGYSVPEDLSVIGLDCLLPPSMFAAEVTTIEQNIGKLSNSVIDLLLKCMNKQNRESEILVETKLIIRKTTK